MGETLAAADAIVSRAGATSLAEISALAIPALLVPYPLATADHQTTNARAWVESGAAFMMPDDELGSDEFNSQAASRSSTTRRCARAWPRRPGPRRPARRRPPWQMLWYGVASGRADALQ